MARVILVGGAVAGVVMAVLLILLPREPIYTALGMSIGLTAGFLTWRPSGVSTLKHILGGAAALVLLFAIFWGMQTIWGETFFV